MKAKTHSGAKKTFYEAEKWVNQVFPYGPAPFIDEKVAKAQASVAAWWLCWCM